MVAGLLMWALVALFLTAEGLSPASSVAAVFETRQECEAAKMYHDQYAFPKEHLYCIQHVAWRN